MKRFTLKTAAATMSAALAFAAFAVPANVLAYDGEVPYSDFGIDASQISEQDQFYDYQEYAVYNLQQAGAGNPGASQLVNQAISIVYSIPYLSDRSLQDNKSNIDEVMDYFLPLIEEANVTEEFNAEKDYMITVLNRLERQQRTYAAKSEVRRVRQAVANLQYDYSLSSSENIQKIYTIVRSMNRNIVVTNGI